MIFLFFVVLLALDLSCRLSFLFLVTPIVHSGFNIMHTFFRLSFVHCIIAHISLCSSSVHFGCIHGALMPDTYQPLVLFS